MRTKINEVDAGHECDNAFERIDTCWQLQLVRLCICSPNKAASMLLLIFPSFSDHSVFFFILEVILFEKFPTAGSSTSNAKGYIIKLPSYYKTASLHQSSILQRIKISLVNEIFGTLCIAATFTANSYFYSTAAVWDHI